MSASHGFVTASLARFPQVSDEVTDASQPRIIENAPALRVTAATLMVLALCGCPRREAAAQRKIALLLPEAKTARYESQDRPRFEARVKALCSDCELIYGNAAQDASKQQSQAEAALTNG